MFEEQGSMAVDLANLSTRVGMKGNTNLNNDILKVFISMSNEINKLKDKVNKLENSIQIVYEDNEFKSKQEEYTDLINSYNLYDFIDITKLIVELEHNELVYLSDKELINEINENLLAPVKLVLVPGLHKFFIINYNIKIVSPVYISLTVSNDDINYIKIFGEDYISNLENTIKTYLNTDKDIHVILLGEKDDEYII